MTLPKPLLFDAIEPQTDILTLEDENSGETMDFVTFGEVNHHEHHYIYGMEYKDFEECFGNRNRILQIQLLECQESETGEVIYSTVTLSDEEEKAIFDLIKFSLKSILVAQRYGVN